MAALEQVHQMVHQLDIRWIETDLVGESDLPLGGHIVTLTRLYAASEDIDTTTSIFDTVLRQACELGKSTHWVNDELILETAILNSGSERRSMLLAILEGEEMNDASLDQYNERVNRFN